MINENIVGAVAQCIASRLSAGLPLDEDAEHFLVSCEGLAGEDEMLLYLESEQDFTQPVFQILFHPDDTIRSEIETLIPASGTGADGPAAVMNRLNLMHPQIAVNAFGRRIPLPYDEFTPGIEQYVRRLNLEISADIFPEPAAGFIDERILLRKKRFVPYSGAGDFLSRLAAGSMRSADPARHELFVFALRLMESRPEDILQHLEKTRYYYESALRESAEFSSLTQKYSMEFIMSKKVISPLVTVHEAEESIKMIDTITMRVYGILIPPMDQGLELQV